MCFAFSKEGSGSQKYPRGIHNSQIEKKSSKNISKSPNRKEMNWEHFTKIQIEKKSVKLVGKGSLKVYLDMCSALSKEGSDLQRYPPGIPSSQTEKKYMYNI